MQRNPNDTAQALEAAVLLNSNRIRALHALFEASAEGRELLRNRPAIDAASVDLERLLQSPAGTLGHEYSHFLKSRGLTPEVFVAPAQVRDETSRYVSQRLRQTHDLWHVLTGYDTDVAGEIELQAFMYGQIRTPFSLLVALVGMLRERNAHARLPQRTWAAYRRGRKAKPFACRAWEKQFDQRVSELREALNLNA